MEAASLEEGCLRGEVLGAPEDKSGNSAELFAGLLELGGVHVLNACLDVFEDSDAIHDHVVLSIDDELLGVLEGLTHLGQSGHILVADRNAVLHHDADLGDELAKLVDAVGDLVVGTVLEVIHGSHHVDDHRVEIENASLQRVDLLSVEGAKDEAIDELDDLGGRHAVILHVGVAVGLLARGVGADLCASDSSNHAKSKSSHFVFPKI
mmetsp:Transcript_27714/g.37016  ORF Transcript_27714/g.37016 Transcript_27714/m.37016 type:complete len:208 (+) Transcript_27714:168-791(+)